MMGLITTDEYAPYREAILGASGAVVTPPRTGRPGRPRKPDTVPPESLVSATVHKTRRRGRVTKVARRAVFGTAEAVEAALARSAVSQAINTAFVERHNGTDRNRNARKVRKTSCFSKDWEVPQAITSFAMSSSTFCWPVRTLRTQGEDETWRRRTPARAAGLTDHVWPLSEWLALPAVQRK
jgi:hypothetical protein